jgi:glycosyltransferase involved in cell wall biosynthesis
MTVFNTAKYVAQAVKSILNQTYRDFDLVIWDDGSTDDSLTIVRKIAEGDPRVRVRGGKHIGILAAHAEAIKVSKGDLIGWIDSDDLLEKTALAQTVAALDANPNAGVVYTDHYEITEDGKRARISQRTKVPYSKDRLLVEFMTFHFRLIRRSTFEAAGGFDPTQPCAAEDYDLCLRLSEVTNFIHLPKPLYFYRLRQHSFSQSHRIAQIEASAAAVRRALARRGMADTHELGVEIQSRFMVRKKRAAEQIGAEAKGLL